MFSDGRDFEPVAGKSKGVFTCENSHRCEFHNGTTVISYRVYIKGGFYSAFYMETIDVGRRECDVTLDWMSKTTHALPVPDFRESDFKSERTVVPR